MHFIDLTAMPKLENQQDKPYLHGRGAQINTANPYHKKIYDEQPIDWSQAEEEHPQIPTQYIDVHPKTIINEVTSPDIPLPYSMNPYQGCEHGCVYCYARNTHPYWGYSAGLDFEQKILVKRNSAALLEEKFRSPRWKAAPVMLAGNLVLAWIFMIEPIYFSFCQFSCHIPIILSASLIPLKYAPCAVEK